MEPIIFSLLLLPALLGSVFTAVNAKKFNALSRERREARLAARAAASTAH